MGKPVPGGKGTSQNFGRGEEHSPGHKMPELAGTLVASSLTSACLIFLRGPERGNHSHNYDKERSQVLRWTVW